MARLAVNVDHVATVRQARGINEPDPVLAAGIAELAGAEGIICHLREDRRHINDRDLTLLRQTVKTKLNLEMAGVDEMVDIAREVIPDLVTLVPEKREELTTEGGLDVASNQEQYEKVVRQLKEKGIEVSFFLDPDPEQIRIAHGISSRSTQAIMRKHAMMLRLGIDSNGSLKRWIFPPIFNWGSAPAMASTTST
jgi:pyridoxine 5-phosphate synthase